MEKNRDDPQTLKNLIDENCRARGWLIFSTHDVDSHPTPYGCTPEFFEEIVQYTAQSDARILTVVDAWKTLSRS
jgi:hypothetical protein